VTFLRSSKKHQEPTKIVYHDGITKPLQLELDRSAKTPLAEQIRNGISNAIESGVLASGARLPSWQDLAAQLGVARGAVRSAYKKLSAAQLIVASRAMGTRVADRPSITVRLDQPPDRGSFMEMYQELTAARRSSRWACLHRQPSRQSSSPGFVHAQFARIRARRSCIRILAANWNCGGK
jgi:GntR family transcriptional regulator/MocR family aminotransferase